ncbi:laminin subunit beta-4 [Cololabis saira]|uniref:laminin subunit beta-4 n=1 Tax=Cololabis saira TaxID=129043 RepID=UPI002AD25BE1|nr:laminin subunit beta-4 [Cololabis saira]
MILPFLIFFIPAVRLQDPQRTQDQCDGISCNPQLGDLMIGRAAQLSTSSTCGLRGPQQYCILGFLEEEKKCFICDSQQPYDRYDNLNSHRIENIISTFDPERKTRWWQSENGVHRVSIQLDLEAVFQFSHLVLTFKSFRPAAMLVERSKDFGRSWKVFRYFAEDCALHFPSVPRESADKIDDVVCDSRYSGSQPSTGGEVVLKALDPVFEIENPYARNIQDLITVTNIRVNFTRLFTLGDTLLSRRRRNPQDKYYYSLYNMVVQGSCFCNGHASQCVSSDGGRGDVFTQQVHGRCVCQHNTAGANCERCADFYQDSPWWPGGQNTANICRRCNCNGHSDSCHFDAARYAATGGVSGGVCDDCQHDRMGPQCERCRQGLYRDPRRAPDDPEACKPCDCDPAGSHGGGQCDALSGACFCKENVEGERCDRCKPRFFGLSEDDPAGCQECKCHQPGSIGSCDQITGECECAPFASKPLCDRCLPGYWGLGTINRCLPCDCDIGGAHDNRCSPEEGQCHCLPNMVGRRCSEPASGYFLPSLDYFLYEAERAAPLFGKRRPRSPPAASLVNPLVSPPCEQNFTRQGPDFNVSDGQVILQRTRRQSRRRKPEQPKTIPLDPGHALQIIPRKRWPGQPVTWTGLGLVRVFAGAGLLFTVDNLPVSKDYQLIIHYEPEFPSDWLATINIKMLSPGDGGCPTNPTESKNLVLPGNTRASILDSPVCLNAGGRYSAEIRFHKQLTSNSSYILVDSMGLIPSIESAQDFCSKSDLDSSRDFHCTGLALESGSQESLPEVCEGIINGLSARIHNGAVACRCNAIGSLGKACSKLGGICDCKPNVIGRCCDTCAPLTFGFGPEGCKRCRCEPEGSVSKSCDQISGQCACRSEVSGRRCDRCKTGFWGFPACRPCECNGLSETCDGETGVCLDCRKHSTGPHCDRCVDGYHGNPVSRQPCQPCLCPDLRTSERFFATSCDHQSLSLTCKCLEGHTGTRCERCSPGFYGDLTLPRARCKPCPCNDNTDPDDHDACDGTTGECLRCLHNTAGPHCENCKPGYYGNALRQTCKECSCDRRGTQVTQCPLDSPCFCNPRTGQCPCRRGVVGDLCDECEDGYWNLDGASGCQPCKCDPTNSLSNVCNKVTGQCPCRAEFGGKQCDECGKNHFGNPDLQCISCGCNLEGTADPSCDSETGECFCRTGVTGSLCDECAPGYESTFPECKECHPCISLWIKNITDVQRAAEKMETLIVDRGDSLEPKDSRHEQQVEEMQSKLNSLAGLTGLSLPKVEKMEKLFLKMIKLKDAIDTNKILINPSLLVNTEIDNIQLEFKKLLNNLRAKLTDSNDKEKEKTEELLEKIGELNKSFMADEKRVKNSKKAVEDSMDTRQEAKAKLSTCSSKGGSAPLEKKINELSAGKLNKTVCGEDCSRCGGTQGPKCDGVVSVSQNASQTAEESTKQLKELPSRLEESMKKIEDAKQLAQDTRDKARDVQERISNNTESYEREKNKTKELIQRVKLYLADESVPPEDIERIVNAVLRIQLPRSTDEIRSMLNDINNLLSNSTPFKNNQNDLVDEAKTVQKLLQEAQDLKARTKDLNVEDINRNLIDADEAQNKANDHLETAFNDKTMAQRLIQEVEAKVDNIEAQLRNQSKDLMKNIDAVKKKTQDNREMAREARQSADSALRDTADTQAELVDVVKQFEDLNQKYLNQTLDQGDAAERIKKILKEAEDIKRQVEDKLRQLQDVETKIKQLLERKKQKTTEVSELMETVDSLRKDIAARAETYATCTS